MPELTKEYVESLTPDTKNKRKYEVYCSKVPGLVLRVLYTGKKVLLIRYRDKNNIDKKVRIGLISPLFQFDDARKIAILKLQEVQKCKDSKNLDTIPKIIRYDQITGSIFVEREVKQGTREFDILIQNMVNSFVAPKSGK